MERIEEDLRKWFGTGGKGGVGGGGWDRYNTKGERIGKCARGKGEGKPKCLSREKAAKMTKKQRAAAVRRKRRQDPVADRPGKGGKPVMVSNKINKESAMTEYTEKPLSEINVGAIIVKENGFVYQIKEIHEMSPNVRYVILEDSYGNYLSEYSNIKKEFYVKEDHLNEEKKGAMGKVQRTPGGPKKFMVRVRGPKGNPVTVRFGDPNMEIKRDDPKRRSNFRARHNCANPGPRWKARYWSCRQWRSGAKVEDSYVPDHGDDIQEAPTMRGIIRSFFARRNKERINRTEDQLRATATKTPGSRFEAELKQNASDLLKKMGK